MDQFLQTGQASGAESDFDFAFEDIFERVQTKDNNVSPLLNHSAHDTPKKSAPALCFSNLEMDPILKQQLDIEAEFGIFPPKHMFSPGHDPMKEVETEARQQLDTGADCGVFQQNFMLRGDEGDVVLPWSNTSNTQSPPVLKPSSKRKRLGSEDGNDANEVGVVYRAASSSAASRFAAIERFGERVIQGVERVEMALALLKKAVTEGRPSISHAVERVQLAAKNLDEIKADARKRAAEGDKNVGTCLIYLFSRRLPGQPVNFDDLGQELNIEIARPCMKGCVVELVNAIWKVYQENPQLYQGKSQNVSEAVKAFVNRLDQRDLTGTLVNQGLGILEKHLANKKLRWSLDSKITDAYKLMPKKAPLNNYILEKFNLGPKITRKGQKVLGWNSKANGLEFVEV